MDIVEAIRSRKSIRGYKPDAVPKEILKEILGIATRAPSAMNTQPWEITIVSGEVLDNIRKGNIEMLNSGAKPHPEVPYKTFEGKYRERQVDLAIQLFKLMGIAREDKEKRGEWTRRGFRFFDAPAGIILSIDRSLINSSAGELMALMDIGSLAQTICLTALKYGLGTCINDQGIMFPEVVRRFTHIPESKLMVICIAIGYPDWNFPANKLETGREPPENVVTWL
jgi:nitroreductase